MVKQETQLTESGQQTKCTNMRSTRRQSENNKYKYIDTVCHLRIEIFSNRSSSRLRRQAILGKYECAKTFHQSTQGLQPEDLAEIISLRHRLLPIVAETTSPTRDSTLISQLSCIADKHPICLKNSSTAT